MEDKEMDKIELQNYVTLMMFFSLLIDPDYDDLAIQNLLEIRKVMKEVQYLMLFTLIVWEITEWIPNIINNIQVIIDSIKVLHF